ncbi:MAG: glycosyl hydrolase 115 family protein [Dysgonamonadaceae bacterium]|jgi:hypothetical protein|nr:glycosyl hydrolase 115 family protein [Dysgonamonadaceae bacterium]
MTKKHIKYSLFILAIVFSTKAFATNSFVSFQKENASFTLAENGNPATILIDQNENTGVLRATEDLRKDIQRVTSTLPNMGRSQNTVIIGTAGNSSLIDQLIKDGKINGSDITGKYEKYIIKTVQNPMEGVNEALVIVGSDRRGTIFGIYELSQQIGVSPWYFWADVPVVPQQNIYIKNGTYTDGEPAVKYRGIFINNEQPALGGWVRTTFGGFNSQFYVHVFELILRLKGNFLWPAMWGQSFFSDDPLNGQLATDYGIVINTTHHEPMGRAHVEWSRYGYQQSDWNYHTNKQRLQQFWREGIERMKNYETIVTLGMRGDGDEPMSDETDIEVLGRIVRDQRQIITEVTGKPIKETPQVWALYKEVQDYYDEGMRVPDDVILLLCNDNWGNVRKLPDPNNMHKGGYGMYYHFDYVGGPRNYKWLNVTQIQRIWEQMRLTYEYGVDQIWLINVGDIKPMEYPISFFLDMAWNPNRFNADNLFQHTVDWSAQQFGEKYAPEIARLINTYTKFNSRVTPELLDANTFSFENYNEFERVAQDYRNLAFDALRLYNFIPNEYKDAFDQLALFPINAFSNVYDMYFAVAKNRYYAEKGDTKANYWADKVKEHFERDSLFTVHYNTQIAGGKWAHMMDQVRIGYTTWQQPDRSIMPAVQYVPETRILQSNIFLEENGFVSIEAENFIRSNAPEPIRWTIVPHLGRTHSSMITEPVTVSPEIGETYLEYDVELTSTGEAELTFFFSPTLNWNANKGLRYAVSINGGEEQIVNINGHYRGELGPWQGERIIKTSTKHYINQTGRNTIRFRVLEPGIVLQKLILNMGGLKPNYLGAPQSPLANQP